jgi:branched-chain amino acid transport system substrate-binding protein
LASEDASILDKVFFGTLAPAVKDSRIDSFQKECAALDVEVEGLFSSLGGDMVKIIEHGIRTAGSTDPSAIRDAIRNADSIPVMSVESISFKETASYALRDIPVIGFKDGQRVVLTEEVPANVPSWP